MKIMLKNVRLSFPCLWEPRDFNGEGKKMFSASFIMAKDDENVATLRKAMMEVAKERWKDKAMAVAKALKASDKIPLHDGDAKADVDGYAGMMYLNARSQMRPLVIDRDRSQLTEADGKPYGGCYVNASIELWAQDNQFGKRINATLRGVQFAKDGEAFAGATTADAGEFDVLEAPKDKFVQDYEAAEEDDDIPDFI